MSDETPRIWIGCLGCYNAGHLVGEWFDAIDAPTDMDRWHSHPNVKGGTWMPKFRIPYTHYDPSGHEELWVFDHEGFGGWLKGECSPAEAVRIAELIQHLEDSNYEPDAVLAWAQHEGRTVTEWDALNKSDFDGAYCGEWISEEGYAEDLAESIGAIDRDASWPNTYIDWERAARDLFMGDYYSVEIPSGGVYVFRNY